MKNLERLDSQLRLPTHSKLGRFELVNAEALAEMRAEQRALKAKRKASGVPDKMFVGRSGDTTVIFCRR